MFAGKKFIFWRFNIFSPKVNYHLDVNQYLRVAPKSTILRRDSNPPRQRQFCYQTSALPPSHHGWVFKNLYSQQIWANISPQVTRLQYLSLRREPDWPIFMFICKQNKCLKTYITILVKLEAKWKFVIAVMVDVWSNLKNYSVILIRPNKRSNDKKIQLYKTCSKSSRGGLVC